VIRRTITTNEVFTEQDTLDLHHSVVSLAYCDFVVLDTKWTRRCREEVALPREVATVYGILELEAFVATLRSWAPPAT
jgi:hypothetical protein